MAYPGSWIVPAFITLAAGSFVPEQSEFKQAADVFVGFVLIVYCSIGAVLALPVNSRIRR